VEAGEGGRQRRRLGWAGCLINGRDEGMRWRVGVVDRVVVCRASLCREGVSVCCMLHVAAMRVHVMSLAATDEETRARIAG
jgi:hypothetical protein